MMKTMKRVLAMLLCFAMGISVLTGCGSKDETGKKKDGNTITIGIPQNGTVEDYETNAFTLWLEEKTGYNIELEIFAATASDYGSQLSTRVVSGQKLPDILWGFNLGAGVGSVYKDYGDSGFLIDLKPYFDDKEKSGTWWERFAEAYPDEFEQKARIEQMTDKDNGAMYAFPSIETTVIDPMQYQVFINKTWLQKLNLDMPTDKDSLVKVLRAFKTQDPNGNGKADEIPLLATDDNAAGMNAIGWLTSFFIGIDEDQWLNVDQEGNIYNPWETDEYRQALIYIRSLFDEKLVPPNSLGISGTDLRNLLNPTDGVNTVGIWCGHPSIYLQQDQTSNYEYGVLPLWSYAVKRDNGFRLQTFISADCENPDAAWEVLMTASSLEGSIWSRYGEYGVDWEWADEGTKSFLGYDAQYKIINDIWGTMNNSHWASVSSTIMIGSENDYRQVSDDDSEWAKFKLNLLKETYDSFSAAEKAHPWTAHPTLSRTREEADATSTIRNNLYATLLNRRSKFLTGTDGYNPSDDAIWAKYVQELKDMGMDTWVEQENQIYKERYVK